MKSNTIKTTCSLGMCVVLACMPLFPTFPCLTAERAYAIATASGPVTEPGNDEGSQQGELGGGAGVNPIDASLGKAGCLQGDPDYQPNNTNGQSNDLDGSEVDNPEVETEPNESSEENLDTPKAGEGLEEADLGKAEILGKTEEASEPGSTKTGAQNNANIEGSTINPGESNEVGDAPSLEGSAATGEANPLKPSAKASAMIAHSNAPAQGIIEQKASDTSESSLQTASDRTEPNAQSNLTTGLEAGALIQTQSVSSTNVIGHYGNTQEYEKWDDATKELWNNSSHLWICIPPFQWGQQEPPRYDPEWTNDWTYSEYYGYVNVIFFAGDVAYFHILDLYGDSTIPSQIENADKYIRVSSSKGVSLTSDGIITFRVIRDKDGEAHFAHSLVVRAESNGKTFTQEYILDNWTLIPGPGGGGETSISIVKGYETPQSVTRRAAFHDRSAVGTNTYHQINKVNGINVSETGDVTIEPGLPEGTYYVDVEVISGGKSTVVTLRTEVLPERTSANEDILSISYQRFGSNEIVQFTGGTETIEGTLDEEAGKRKEREPWYRYDINLRAGDRLIISKKNGEKTYELREVLASDGAADQARFVNIDDEDDWINANEVVLEDGQSYENQWDVGTHPVKVTYAGHTTSFDVEIVQRS